MTNGEKIKELFPHFDFEDKTEYFGRLRNLDDHFIKADIDFWNAEYKEPSGDLISRQAVLDELSFYLNDTTMIEEDIKKLPSVNPQEPKTGHWKRISIDKYSEHAKYWYRCDRCGKDNLGNTDWCPNCGCRMVEPKESEEV